MQTIQQSGSELAAERLAAELADVHAAIVLVESGTATRVTFTGLRFGRAVAQRLSGPAAEAGVAIETSWWPEDDACDVRVSRADG